METWQSLNSSPRCRVAPFKVFLPTLPFAHHNAHGWPQGPRRFERQISRLPPVLEVIELAHHR
eukprot:scaffold116607_cov60-Phaeocystis_antarctica.AAC.2